MPISKSELNNCDVSLEYGYDKLNDSEKKGKQSNFKKH